MFFRRERPHNPTFAERLDSLRKAGFTVSQPSGGKVRVSRENCAIDLTDSGGSVHSASLAGIAMGNNGNRSTGA